MKPPILLQEVPDYGNLYNSLVIDRSNYTFVESHCIGISILSDYYQILLDLSKHDFDQLLKYLYYKYHKRILSQKQAPYKRTATAIYQPKSKNYKNVKLKNVSPYIWDKYWDLRKMTGYSISYIIRIFLEWEIEYLGQSKIDKVKTHKKEYKNIEVNICDFQDFKFKNNNDLKKWGSSQENKINIIFRDTFY